MNKWKIAFIVSLFAGLACSATLFLHLIDSGISYSYLHDSYTAESRRFNALGGLVVAESDDYTKADLLHLLRQANVDAFIVEEDNAIHFEGITFVFENGKLTDVK